MSDQIVITEKTSQAKDVRAAVGGRYGAILPAEGHLFDLVEPEEVDPAWKRWTPVLLRPEGLYATRPAAGGNKAPKLQAIRAALQGAKRVWLATDCDREGQLIGQEILEHYGYRGEVLRVMFTAQDPQTIREAFSRARPNSEYARLYAAAVARRQADQIYNLSLTRTATVTLARGARAVIGVGRVKTPTLAIVCKRELEIRNFVPQTYFEVVATAAVEAGSLRLRHAPKERILEREKAEAIAALAEGFAGPLAVKVEDKRQGPPRLHDLPSLQKLCGSRFGWSAARTLEVAQALYDGEGKKVITYPRAETRYLPEALIAEVPKLVAGLQVGRAFAEIPVPQPPVIRRGGSGAFHDKGLAGASHHAIIPNPNTVDTLREVWPRLSADERRLFDVIARAFLAAVMPDFRYRQTTATLDVQGHVFRAAGRQPLELGWRAAFPDWTPAEERGEEAQLLPALRHGETATLRDAAVEEKETRPPPRYNEGTLIEAMQNAWRFVADEALQERLKEAKGIGTPATRAEVIRGLKAQDFLCLDGKHIVPTPRGLELFGVLERADPALVDPGVTAQLEVLLDGVLVGQAELVGAIDAVCAQASRIIERLKEHAGSDTAPLLGVAAGGGGPGQPPTPAMKRFVDSLARQKGLQPPRGYTKSGALCRTFLDQHAPRKAGAEGGDGAVRPPSPAQLGFAGKLAAERGVELPEEARASARALSAWIDAQQPGGGGRAGGRPPSRPAGGKAASRTAKAGGGTPRRAGRAAAGTSRRGAGEAPPSGDGRIGDEVPPWEAAMGDVAPPGEAREGGAAAHRASGLGEDAPSGPAAGAPVAKRRRAPRGATPPAAEPVRARKPAGGKRAPQAAPAEAEGGTPLRIPFGNKEAALRCGARYRAGGWYAPPGTDLDAFRERGWL
ncbi:DNA topoisomerase [Roseomonas sp. BN140053]|uniref:DNA topoisomerase n=1 Tax=Roseomonas sp. BN140053 TaxID=3391898 RepID=UPI0039E7E69D